MKQPLKNKAGARAWAGHFAVLLLLLSAARGYCGDTPSLPEPEVKALCLLNFAKYVEWPDEAFVTTNDPITIGCIGEGKILDNLKKSAEGKTIGGRKVTVVSARTADTWGKCNLLFVDEADKKRLPEILDAAKYRPVLIVGESDHFLQQGGAINLLKKDGKVRFEIDIEAARAAHLQISSRLLSLADNVRDKP